MNWKRRRIRMPGRFDPARWEMTAGIGARETVLIGVAAAQAIWLVFLNEAWPFVLRLVVALAVGLTLLGVAMVPVKDKPIEYHLLKFLRYRLRPPGRVYRTARKGAWVMPAPELETQVPSEHATKPARASTRFVPIRRVACRLPAWLQLDTGLGLVLAAFVCVLIAGSAIAYVGRGGGHDDSLDPDTALIAQAAADWSASAAPFSQR